ncbi:MAG: hypothetical protein ABIV25_07935 [Paracoccaceae bacterium]
MLARLHRLMAIGVIIAFGLNTPANGQSYANNPPLPETAPATSVYVADLYRSIAFCRAIGRQAYMVDCLAERIGAVAAKMPASGDRADMRAALATASRELGAVANKYRSRTQSPVNMTMGGANSMTTTRPLRGIAPENLNLALTAALTVMAQTETVLLRSAQTSQTRALDFQEVAGVIGSTKVLLRSG